MNRDNINFDGKVNIYNTYLMEKDTKEDIKSENDNLLYCFSSGDNSDDFIHTESSASSNSKNKENKTIKENNDGSKVITEKTENGYTKKEYDKDGNLTREETLYNGEKTKIQFDKDNNGYEKTEYDEKGNLTFKEILKKTEDGYINNLYDENGKKLCEAVKKGNLFTSTSYNNDEIVSINTTTETGNISETIKTDKDGNIKEKKYTHKNEDGLITKLEKEVFNEKGSIKTTTEYKTGKKINEIYNNTKNGNYDKITKEFKENNKTIYKEIRNKESENGVVFLVYDENGKQIAGKIVNSSDDGYEKNEFFSSVDKNIKTVKNGDTTNITVSQNNQVIGKGIIKTNNDGSKEETYINENGRKTVRTTSKNGEISVKRYDENGKEIKLSDTINGEFDENTYQGGLGNCWFISGLNAINSTPKGKEIIRNAITKNDDGSVTVTFKGLGASYTITEDEFNKYDTDFDLEDIYSNGDNDLLALEIAYKNIKDINLLEIGGQSRILVEDLTGIESKTYGSYYTECPEDKIDEALDDVLNNKNIALNFALSGINNQHFAKRTNGETFAYVAKESHAFAVTNVTKDTVTFINPWSSSDEITMTRDEFKKLGIIQVSSCDLSNY